MSSLPAGTIGRTVIDAETLAARVEELAPDSEVVIMSAAVADFRPLATLGSKIKKGSGAPDLKLEGTEDILARLETSDRDRCHMCRLCDGDVCTDCPIPADFREAVA